MGVFPTSGTKRVGLFPTPCLERYFPAGKTEVSFRLYCSAEPALSGCPHFWYFVEITLNRGAPDVFEQFNAAVQNLKKFQRCHLVSGDFDLTC